MPGLVVRRASRRRRVASKFTFMPKSKLASAPDDMIPWKMYTTSRVGDRMVERDEGSHRSALIVLAFWGYLTSVGIGGSITSVSVR